MIQEDLEWLSCLQLKILVDSVVAYELTKYPDVLRKNVNIPDTEDIAVGIALGYETDDAVNKFRAKKHTVEEVCHFVK